MSRLLFKLSPRLHFHYCMAWAKLRYGPISNVVNALYFCRVAWHFLCGRMLLITTEEPISKGGFRYYALVISKRPLSATNTYNDL